MATVCCPNCKTRIVIKDNKTEAPIIMPRKGNGAYKLLEAFATYPERALGDQEAYELAQELYPDFTSRNYWQKITSLIGLNLVKQVGKRTTPSGGYGRTSRITEQGLRFLRK